MINLFFFYRTIYTNYKMINDINIVINMDDV